MNADDKLLPRPNLKRNSALTQKCAERPVACEQYLGRIRFSETETCFSLLSALLCILLCETKTGFRNHRNHPRTWFRWFRCWNVATPTCLLVRAGRWKL